MASKINELRFIQLIEQRRPAPIESRLVIKSVKGVLYMETYREIVSDSGTRISTDAQKGVGSIAIKGFSYVGSLN